MTPERSRHNGTVRTYRHAPTRTVAAGGTTFAYRELGPREGIPVVFFVHLAATLDNWDPALVDQIAQHHHVIAFDNRGVGALSPVWRPAPPHRGIGTGHLSQLRSRRHFPVSPRILLNGNHIPRPVISAPGRSAHVDQALHGAFGEVGAEVEGIVEHGAGAGLLELAA